MSRLTLDQLKLYLNKAPGWNLSEDGMALYRTFAWGSLAEAVRFVSRVAELLEAEGRDPDIRVRGRGVTVTLTGSERGLSGREIALAQAINKLV